MKPTRVFLALLSLVSPPAFAADYRDCTPMDGLNRSSFFRFGPGGESVVQEADPQLLRHDATDPFGERFEFSQIDSGHFDVKTGNLTVTREHRQTLYVTRESGKPARLTYAQPEGGANQVSQDSLGYRANGRCRTERSIRWRQAGERIDDLHLTHDPQLCRDLLRVYGETRPASEGEWFDPSKPGPTAAEKAEADREFLRRMVPLMRKHVERYRRTTIHAPGIGPREVEVPIEGTYAEGSAWKTVKIDPERIGKDPATDKAMLGNVGVCSLGAENPNDDATTPPDTPGRDGATPPDPSETQVPMSFRAPGAASEAR